MKCPRCQQETPPDAEYCPECGAKLILGCAHCGTPNAPSHKFCKKCGQLLSSQIRTSEPTLLASPETYTPRHLAERILTSKSALEGERKQVTVLFADLKGSMELLADRDPEDARKLLDPMLGHMMDAVHRYEGTVNQVMGDGIMALFGAPIAQEDHAARACYAALRMQETVKRYAEGVRQVEGIPIQIRVGLNSGEVVVRSIGSDLRMDYTAVGQTTHLAARMEQLATPGSILMTPDTLRLAEGYVQVASLGSMPVKGLSAAIEVFELTGAGAMRSRFQAATARGLGPFVGRDIEMAQLGQALERAAQGHGQVVAVAGEPGVGKSRLYWEFIRSHRTRDWLVLESRSVSYGRSTTYLPVISLLKDYFHIDERDPAREIREAVTGKVLALERALEPAVVPLLALLELAGEASGWERLEPSQRRQRTQDALKRLLLRESQVQPLVLVFEDLHWIDAETQAFLDGMVASLPTARILLLVNYRPEYRHGWGGKTYVRELRVDPLPPASAEELLRSMLGPAPDLEPLKRLLIERTEGNPLFLEESVRTLIETQGLVGERGAYRLGRPTEAGHVPATVQAILGARIDRLAPDDKRLLQTAAVIGKDVPLALVEMVAELPDEALRGGLARLQGAEFLYEAALFPELEYTFKHALTHEVAYGSLLQERRRALHARIVEAMEQLYADRRAEHVERLGYHALRAEVWDKALQYLREAGEKALARSAHREAAASLEHALEANEKLPRTKPQILDGIDLRTALRTALFPLAERGKILACLRQAESLAEAIGDQARVGRILTFIAAELWLNADYPYTEALAVAERATAIGDALGDTGIRAFARFRAGQVFHDLGEYRRAAKLQRESLALIGQQDRVWSYGQPQWLPATWLCMSLSELGEFDEAARHGEDTLRLVDAAGNLIALTHVTMALGRLWLRRGEIERAAAISERGRDLAQAQSFQLLQYHNTAALGYGLGLAGRLVEGEALLREALSGTESGFGGFARALFMTWLAEIELMAGEGQRARHHGDEALQIARARGERGNEAWAFRLLAEIAAHVHDPDQVAAAHNYQSALALASGLGMRPLVAQCYLGLGKQFLRTGQRDQAREHLETAISMLREMGITYWLLRAEAELKLLG